MMSRDWRTAIIVSVLSCLAMGERVGAEGYEFGPSIAFPVPNSDVGDSQLGLNAGMTVSRYNGSIVGMGLDLAYHFWPASSAYKTAYDEFLKNTYYQVIDESVWTFSALQATVHMKVLAPLKGPIVPFIQGGIGIYRVNRHLEGLPFAVGLNGEAINNVNYEFGYTGSLGFDFKTSSTTRLGLEASYHGMNPEMKSEPTFSAFSLGVHALFGRW